MSVTAGVEAGNQELIQLPDMGWASQPLQLSLSQAGVSSNREPEFAAQPRTEPRHSDVGLSAPLQSLNHWTKHLPPKVSCVPKASTTSAQARMCAAALPLLKERDLRKQDPSLSLHLDFPSLSQKLHLYLYWVREPERSTLAPEPSLFSEIALKLKILISSSSFCAQIPGKDSTRT